MQAKSPNSVFTPSSPISSPELLVGREVETTRLLDYLERPGAVPVLVGDRGVGKTSVVKQALRQRDHIRVDCSEGITFDSLARAILRRAGISVDETESAHEITKSVEGKALPFGVGVSISGVQKDVRKKSELGQRKLDPLSLFEQLETLTKEFTIVLDEYDRLDSKSGIKTLVVDLAKAIADHGDSCQARLVIVGVAQSARQVLGHHESIHRSVHEMKINPLREEDIFRFLSAAESRLDITFEASVKKDLSHNSLGYPYFVHLVGLESVRAMRNRDSTKTNAVVTPSDLTVGKREAVSLAFQHLLARYKQAVYGLSDEDRAIVRAVVYSGAKGPTRFSLKRKLAERGVLSEEGFERVWSQLTKRGLLYALRDSDEIRFNEPLLKPFLLVLFGRATNVNQMSLFD